MARTDAERLRLHLLKPTCDRMYTPVEFTHVDIFRDISEIHDPVTGFLNGASERDFELANESARAVIALYQQSAHREVLERLLIQAVRENNSLVIGAVIVQLGLTKPLDQAIGSD